MLLVFFRLGLGRVCLRFLGLRGRRVGFGSAFAFVVAVGLGRLLFVLGVGLLRVVLCYSEGSLMIVVCLVVVLASDLVLGVFGVAWLEGMGCCCHNPVIVDENNSLFGR